MRRRGNEFGRADARWASRDIFGERRRRRIRWVPILFVVALAAGVYALSDPERRGRALGLWAELSKPAPAARPERGDQLGILPLPPEPPAAH
jgi:hypothetical protein